jgi:hypothetical protein
MSSTDAQVRRSALVVAAALSLIAAVRLWRGGTPWILAAVAMVLALLAVVMPRVLQAPYRIWMAAASALGFIVSRAMLLLVFALVVTPIALVARLLGKRFLELRPDPAAPTYWLPRPQDAPSRYDRMY